MVKLGNILWGIVLIVLGIIIGANALGITNINLFFDGWWTLFIIIPCFIGLFKEREKTGNVIGLIIGVVLLLSCQGYLDFNMIWKLLIPGILVAVGISIIFKDIIGGKVKEEIKRLNKNKTSDKEYCSTFSGQTINFSGEKFTGTDLTAVFGGIDCNLKEAIIESDVVINVSAIFGGVDIFVPENVKVKIQSSSIFGGVSDNKKRNEQKGEHTIYINANCVFGGVEVK